MLEDRCPLALTHPASLPWTMCELPPEMLQHLLDISQQVCDLVYVDHACPLSVAEQQAWRAGYMIATFSHAASTTTSPRQER